MPWNRVTELTDASTEPVRAIWESQLRIEFYVGSRCYVQIQV